MIRLPLSGVRHALAVASGKGGVGKTTVTVNLALALQKLGARVGIFDADVYGPNVPLMLGVHQRQDSQGWVPIVRPKDAPAYIRPLERFGLKVMSVGLLVSENQVINPQASAAGQVVVQTLRDMLWGELDYLLIDLPPSAGQPQEDLLQQVPMAGVIIVTTPQDLSLLDSSRSLQLFHRAGVPVLGLVENMSYFICPNCGEEHEIFQHSDRWRPKALEDVPVLGRIPLAPGISQGINQANPLMHDHPDSPQARIFLDIAAAVREQIE
ncbi:MAG: Mrp/NBP35 family ATP-binding protein [Chloroflexi bacterium]|nr:Mrp/NBP35 family ATP-binding protein [Chloroflexota bacterium]MCI0574854.1 Mrp/NBP35 family ATP-binding protein [Chloroflexota bacterium]MCI0645928.1 Mrp/NBP35 family ATP-binding protein [Chloroflexota bacterium]MCI0726903.1 Mrp/NBP35 family ATP-binding protein [Chloroflexota bacterium]